MKTSRLRPAFICARHAKTLAHVNSRCYVVYAASTSPARRPMPSLYARDARYGAQRLRREERVRV